MTTLKQILFLTYKSPVSLVNYSKNQLNNLLVQFGIQIIKTHNKDIRPVKFEIETSPKNPNYQYIMFQTAPNNNHPYIMGVDLLNSIIIMVIPFGNDAKQNDLNQIPDVLPHCNYFEIYALYLAILKSINLRKKGILEDDQYNLLQCSNISNCQKKFNEIRKMRISKEEKEKQIKEYKIYYQKKAVTFLKTYFDLLTNQDYNEAFQFLKGNQGKYFGKQRLNTFFKNSKSIIGHLQIFIPLYQMGTLLSSKISKNT